VVRAVLDTGISLPILEVEEAVKDVFSFRDLLYFVNFIWTLNCHERLFRNFRLSFPLLAKLNVSKFQL